MLQPSDCAEIFGFVACYPVAFVDRFADQLSCFLVEKSCIRLHPPKIWRGKPHSRRSNLAKFAAAKSLAIGCKAG